MSLEDKIEHFFMRSFAIMFLSLPILFLAGFVFCFVRAVFLGL